MARGLIEGALGGLAQAAGNISGGYIKNEQEVELRKQLSDIEEQRQLRIQEAQERTRQSGRQADFNADIANAPAKNQLEIDRLKTVSPVEAEAAANRTGAVTRASGAAERANEAALGTDKAALAGIRAKTTASDLGAGERALRTKELESTIRDKDTVRQLLQQAAEARAGGDEENAKAIEEQVRTLQGQGAKGEKSYADVVKAAQIYEGMAKDLLDPMKQDPGTDPTIAAKQAAEYRQKAADLLNGVGERKLPGSGGKSSAKAQPYPEGTELNGPGGQLYIVRNGKPVPKDAQRKVTGTVTQE